MSKIEITEIECYKCKKTSKYKIYSSINVRLNPELKEQIFDRSIYWHECPICFTEFDVLSNLLYNDVNQKIVIWLKVPNKNGIPTLEKPVDKAARLFVGCQTRIVSDSNQFVRKN